MTRQIRLLDEAEDDLINAQNFYERQSDGVGDYFLDSIFSDIESLRLYAGIHPKHFGYHRLLARRFPYAIYYKLAEEAVEVHAILDCRRNPDDLKNRF